MPPKYSREITQPIVLADSLKEQFRTSPCEVACPAGNPIQKMLALSEQGNFTEALRYLYAKNPFPGMTGRTCPHFCQSACNRNQKDACVHIRGLERAAYDYAEQALNFTRRPATGKKVSIIGGGPAGLTSAYFLSLLGHTVTVYEAAPMLGGMPRHAVPAFRLPRDVVDREVGRVLATGVRALVNTRVGQDISFDAIRADSDAVIIATGAPTEKKSPITNANFALMGVEYLHTVALGQAPALGKSVVIIGGGGVACDCASTARRMGAETVQMLYRRAESEMPAPQEDLAQAKAEGVAIVDQCVVTGICVENGKVTAVECHSVCNCKKDADGHMTCDIVSGSERRIACDSVIFAIGMGTNLDFLPTTTPSRTAHCCIATNAQQQSDMDGIFAAGDVATGPASIAQAVGAGRKTAFSVHSFLTGEKSRVYVIDANNTIAPCDHMAAEQAPHIVAYEEMYGLFQSAKIPAQKQAVDYTPSLGEVRKGYSREQAQQEAARCFHCGHCKQCGTCVADCPGYVLEMCEVNGQQRPEAVHAEECWHCANCRTSCPCGAIAFTFPLFMQV